MIIQFTATELVDVLGEWADLKGIAQDTAYHRVIINERKMTVTYLTNEDAD